MPNFLRNWSFEDVKDFLVGNHFFVIVDTKGSHYYFLGNVDDRQRLVELQYHAKEAIHPKTLRYYVIHESGIPEEYWLSYASAGKKKKKVVYPGARLVPPEWIKN